MQRIQVQRRRFGYKTGNTFYALKEYKSPYRPGKDGLTFIANLPDSLERKTVRAEILKRIVPKETE